VPGEPSLREGSHLPRVGIGVRRSYPGRPYHPAFTASRTRTFIVLNRLCLSASFAGLASLLLLPSLSVVSAADDSKKPECVLDFHAKDIDGKDVELSKYKGDVFLIVNTASQCGLTPQYKELEEMYEKYKEKGFEILAFPANEFGGQEPGSNEKIKEFCSTKYKVTFPLFSKIVVKGEGIDPLYEYLTSKKTNPKYAGDIPWNFTKFLVNRKGEVIARFKPQEKPSSKAIETAIEKALAEKKS
jgi:glutathione peroxidase